MASLSMSRTSSEVDVVGGGTVNFSASAGGGRVAGGATAALRDMDMAAGVDGGKKWLGLSGRAAAAIAAAAAVVAVAAVVVNRRRGGR